MAAAHSTKSAGGVVMTRSVVGHTFAVLLLPAVVGAATITLQTRGDIETTSGDVVIPECTLGPSTASATTITSLATSVCSLGEAAALGGQDSSGFLTLGALAEALAGNGVEVDASAIFTDTVIANGPTGESGFIHFEYELTGTSFNARGSTFIGAGYSWTCGTTVTSSGTEPVTPTVSCDFATTFGSPTDVQFGLRVGAFGTLGGNTADFLHTATLTQILLLDSNGNVIDGSIRSTTPGFSYIVPATNVPEPSSMLLFGSAFIAVGAKRWRVRQRASSNRLGR